MTPISASLTPSSIPLTRQTNRLKQQDILDKTAVSILLTLNFHKRAHPTTSSEKSLEPKTKKIRLTSSLSEDPVSPQTMQTDSMDNDSHAGNGATEAKIKKILPRHVNEKYEAPVDSRTETCNPQPPLFSSQRGNMEIPSASSAFQQIRTGKEHAHAFSNSEDYAARLDSLTKIFVKTFPSISRGSGHMQNPPSAFTPIAGSVKRGVQVTELNSSALPVVTTKTPITFPSEEVRAARIAQVQKAADSLIRDKLLKPLTLANQATKMVRSAFEALDTTAIQIAMESPVIQETLNRASAARRKATIKIVKAVQNKAQVVEPTEIQTAKRDLSKAKGQAILAAEEQIRAVQAASATAPSKAIKLYTKAMIHYAKVAEAANTARAHVRDLANQIAIMAEKAHDLAEKKFVEAMKAKDKAAALADMTDQIEAEAEPQRANNALEAARSARKKANTLAIMMEQARAVAQSAENFQILAEVQAEVANKALDFLLST